MTGLLRAGFPAVIVVGCLGFSFGLLPSAIADEKCLRIVFPEVIGNDEIVSGA